MRIAILGYSGSGKSTLAKALGRYYGCPVLHLDCLHFRENWQERPDQEALQILKPYMRNSHWVIDGNYRSLAQEKRLELADHIIILALPRFLRLRRAWNRYRQHRGQVRDSVAPGCLEKFDLPFAWWILHKGCRKAVRLHYNAIQARYPEKTTFCTTPEALDRILREGLPSCEYAESGGTLS